MLYVMSMPIAPALPALHSFPLSQTKPTDTDTENTEIDTCTAFTF